MNSANKLVDGILGGWGVSALFTYNTGTPIRLGSASVSGDPALSHPTSGEWFDITKVAVLPAFTVRTNPIQYSDLVGPRFVNLDATLGKQFRIAERVKFELRMEAYNARMPSLPPTRIPALAMPITAKPSVLWPALPAARISSADALPSSLYSVSDALSTDARRRGPPLVPEPIVA